MNEYRDIHWRDDRARLKTYSGSAGPNGRAVVKIELEVFDPVTLGYILQDLAKIKQEQEAAAKAAVKPSREPKKLSQPPRLLTYRGGE